VQHQGVLVRVDLDHGHLMRVVIDVDPKVEHAWVVGFQERPHLTAGLLGDVELAVCDRVGADVDE
jgi:hypothetical protein